MLKSHTLLRASIGAPYTILQVVRTLLVHICTSVRMYCCFWTGPNVQQYISTLSPKRVFSTKSVALPCARCMINYCIVYVYSRALKLIKMCSVVKAKL